MQTRLVKLYCLAVFHEADLVVMRATCVIFNFQVAVAAASWAYTIGGYIFCLASSHLGWGLYYYCCICWVSA